MSDKQIDLLRLNGSISDLVEQVAESADPPSVPLLPAGPCPTCKMTKETAVPYCAYCGWDSVGTTPMRPRGVGWKMPNWMREHFGGQRG